MCPEDHVVYDGLVYQVAYFDEARYCGYHAQNTHLELDLKEDRMLLTLHILGLRESDLNTVSKFKTRHGWVNS